MSTIAPHHDSTAAALVELYRNTPAAAARDLDLLLLHSLKRTTPAARAALAEQLARQRHGPTLTLRALACDEDPWVALPVLQHSSAICDDALAEQARCKGDEHLTAIAARRNLNKKVTAILARRGSREVLKTLSRNKTAAFSRSGKRLLERRLNSTRPAPRPPIRTESATSSWSAQLPAYS